MTKSVSEDEDSAINTGRGSFFSVSLVVWVSWPAVFVLIFRDATYDFVRVALIDYFFYPPALNNVIHLWAEGGMVYKSLYLSAWFVNSLLIACRYAIYLLENPRYLRDSIERDSVLKMVVLGLAASGVSCGMYSGLVFNGVPPLSLKEELLLKSEIGFLVGLPAIYLWVACAPVGTLFSILVVWHKLTAKSAKE